MLAAVVLVLVSGCAAAGSSTSTGSQAATESSVPAVSAPPMTEFMDMPPVSEDEWDGSPVQLEGFWYFRYMDGSWPMTVGLPPDVPSLDG